MRLFIHDFGGYAFILQLSKTLAQRGHQVCHAFYGSHQTTPPGVQQIQTGDIPNLEIKPIALSSVLDKYNFYKRFKQESEYGHVAARAIHDFKPDLVLSANTPLDAQKTLTKVCNDAGIPFIFWIQDLLGIAAYKILKRKIPVLGSLVGKHYIRLEDKLIKQSDAIVTITHEFSRLLSSLNKESSKPVYLIQNWAPLDQLPVVSKENRWSIENNLTDKFCFLYSGTLSMKHDPDVLLQLALAFKDDPDTRVVVVSQGLGANWLKEQVNVHNLTNLLVLPYQPVADLPDVLGTADVTVTLLDDAAGSYSVPSKVFTYMCAGRPLLMSAPLQNYAARLIKEHTLGFTSMPADTKDFLSHARRLKENADLRQKLGQNARTQAENLFDIDKIANTFEELFGQLTDQA